MIHVYPDDEVRFRRDGRTYTVQAVTPDHRWAVCTTPGDATPACMVVDFACGLRGAIEDADLRYDTAEQCAELVALFESGEAYLGDDARDLDIVQWAMGAA